MTRRFRLCRQRHTSAGLALDDLGLTLWSHSAAGAVQNAKALGMFCGLQLVALPEES